MSIHWAATAPPEGPRHGPQVFTVPAFASYVVCWLGPPVEVWIHWIGSRSHPCNAGGGEVCAHHQHELRLRAYGPAVLYRRNPDKPPKPKVETVERPCPITGKMIRFAVQPERTPYLPGADWVPIVCDLTAACYDRLRGQTWRGLVTELTRKDRRRDGELLAKVMERWPDEGSLAPAFDVKPILERVWNVRARYLPLPAPQLLVEPDPSIETAEAPLTLPFPGPEPRQPRQSGGAG